MEEADILLHAGLSEVWVKCSGIVRSVHSLTLSDQLFWCLPRLRPPSTVPCMIVSHGQSCLVTWPNQVSFRRLIVARSGSWGPTWMHTVFLTYSLVLAPYRICPEVSSNISFETLGCAFQSLPSGSMLHIHTTGWIPPGTYRACIWCENLCCSSKSCLVWPWLLWLWQF